MFGRNTPTENRPDTTGPTMDVAAEASTTNSTHNHNSDRDARPSKPAYLLKQVLIDSTKVIVSSPRCRTVNARQSAQQLRRRRKRLSKKSTCHACSTLCPQ